MDYAADFDALPSGGKPVNNPLNLRPRGASKGFQQFDTPEAGLGEADRLLKDYGSKGINTLSGVISRWAPPSENDTNAYVADVSKRLNLDPNQQIDLSNPLQRHAISGAMMIHEQGAQKLFASAKQPNPQAQGTDYAADWDNLPTTKPAEAKAPTQAAPATAQTVQPSGMPGKSPAPEVIQTIVSGLGAQVIGGLHGLYKLATTGDPDAAANTVKSDVQALTHQPTGPQAKVATAAVGDILGSDLNPLNWIPNLIKASGEKTFDKTNSPGAAVAAETVGNAASMLLPGALLAKAGKVAPEVAAAVKAAPEIKSAQSTPVNYDIPSIIRKRNPQAGPQPTAQPAPHASVGASSATTVDSINAMTAGSSPQLRDVIQKASTKPDFNPDAAKRQIEADSLPVPVALTEGQATQDPILISKEMNERGKNEKYVQRLNQQNQLLKDNLNIIRDDAAPDAFGVNHVQNGETVLQAYKDADNVVSAEISKKYKALEAANGGQFPLDGQAFVKTADAALAKQMKGRYVPSEIKADMEDFRGGQTMTFENFENLRTNLAAEQRKAERSGDGNASHAIGIVRESLENLPMPAGAEHLKPLADAARSAAKARFDMIKNDPAYKAALNGIEPDKFIQKYVVGGSRREVAQMVHNLGVDSVAHQTIKAGVLNYLKRQAGVVDEAGNFSQAGYNKALDQLRPKLDVVFKPDEIKQLEALGRTARYTQFQPRGSYVNNSNTFTAAIGEQAKTVAAGMANYAAHGIPVGSVIKKAFERSGAAKDLNRTLQTGAGVRTKP